jgi:hypothetical protein
MTLAILISLIPTLVVAASEATTGTRIPEGASHRISFDAGSGGDERLCPP